MTIDLAGAAEVRDLLGRSTETLRTRGIAEPRREAMRIFADLLGVKPGDLSFRVVDASSRDQLIQLESAIARRASGEPLAYVTGFAGFRKLELEVDRRVLIPRPETEGLVDRVLALSPAVVADVGTGSGCVALAIRDEGRCRQVLAVDQSEAALAVASRNRRRLGLDVDLIRGDLALALRAESVDVIVSNPPYVSVSEYQSLDASVRDHEPRVALESGPDGLDATRRLLADARRVVRPGGSIVVEIAADRALATASIARGWGWTDVRVDRDLFGRPRYLTAVRGTK